MSVSDYDFKLLRDDIITRAFRIPGVVGLDDTLTAGQLKQGTDILNALVLSWQDRGTFLWTWCTFDIPLVVGQSSYDLPVDPPLIHIESGRIGTAKVEPVSYVEYRDLDEAQGGRPTLFAPNGVGKLLLWPVPNSDSYTTFSGLGVRRSKDWDSASSDGGFPPAWGNALVYGVAAELAPEYGVPLSERQLLRLEAESAYKIARRREQPRTNTSFIKSSYRQ